MLILHGFAYSNYYNAVKHVLMHKGLQFEEDLVYGGGDEWLAISPLGKIPALTTEQGGHLSETVVICDYLEETYRQQPLYPQDTFQRARVRQIMKVAELYLELPCRRLISFSFQNQTPPGQLLEEIRAQVERGIGALNRLCVFSPYLTGTQLTMADYYVRCVNMVVKVPGAAVLEWDILGQIHGMHEWDEMMAGLEDSRKIDADQEANAAPFFAHLKERFGV